MAKCCCLFSLVYLNKRCMV